MRIRGHGFLSYTVWAAPTRARASLVTQYGFLSHTRSGVSASLVAHGLVCPADGTRLLEYSGWARAVSISRMLACVPASVGLLLAPVSPASFVLCTHPGTFCPGLILFYSLQICARGRHCSALPSRARRYSFPRRTRLGFRRDDKAFPPRY